MRGFQLNQNEVYLTASIGVAFCPRDAENVIDLIRNADAAMYYSKQNGGNTFAFYSPEMNSAIAERLEMQSALRAAVENEQFELLYQPKIDLVTRRIAGMEALLRIKDAGGALLLPQQYIRLAEESGLIVSIGEWVMREAFAFNKSLQVRGLPPMRVAINLSTHDLQDGELPEFIMAALHAGTSRRIC